MIGYTKKGALHLVTMNDGPNTICPDWQQRMLEILDTADEAIAAGIADGKAPMDELLEQAKALASQLGTKEPGIFKTLKQAWFGPTADALVAS